MPRISEFYGINIYMYYRDHAPPHFHAIYAGDDAAIAITDGSLVDGKLPRRAMKLVQDWLASHRNEMDENWRRARTGRPLLTVPPLD